MYRKLFLVLLAISLLFLRADSVHAHPIDNTDSYFYLEKEIDGYPLKENEIKMYSYINWTQAGLLVKKDLDILVYDIEELLKYQNIYNQYIKNNIKISNNGDVCPVTIDESPVTEEQISLSLGTRVMGTFTCSSKIDNVKIENTLFLSDFEFESNYTEIYSGDALLHALTLDKNRKVYEFNAKDLKLNPKGNETVDNSASLTADQVMGDVPVDSTTGTQDTGPKESSFISSITDVLFLRANSIKDQSVPVLLGLVFLLGFLHTVEAGHSKSILASSMVHKKMDLKKGLMYAVVFTVTHLADIIIVGLILLVADNYLNILSNFSMLEKFAGYALFLMAIYLLLKSLRNFLGKWSVINKNLEIHGYDHEHGHDHDHSHELDPDMSFKDQLILGILAGLAPCVFGWSIFMLILSTNKIWILMPSILSFGLGIFLALAILVFLITHLKTRAYSKFEKIAEISPLVSAVFLLIYSIFLIT